MLCGLVEAGPLRAELGPAVLNPPKCLPAGEEGVTAVVSLQQDCDLANWGVDFPALQWRAGELGVSLERCPVRPLKMPLLPPAPAQSYQDGQVCFFATQPEVACRACVTRTARMAVQDRAGINRSVVMFMSAHQAPKNQAR